MSALQPPTPARRVFAFALALASVHAVLWVYAAHREGFWIQAPSTDQSSDLATALVLKRALFEEGPRAFVHAWMHQSPVHSPLVPLASALLMAIFGESRIVAECVLPLATLLLAYGVFRVVERLYDARTAVFATLLTTSFPVFLIYSRTYLFEHPLAAVFAITCWSMLRTDGFGRWKPTIVFGVCAGLTALTRAGSPVFLVGPTCVAAWIAVRRGDAVRRLARLSVATGIAIALAATWYVPNFESLREYVYSHTYGEEAVATAGGSSLSVANLVYYLEWNLGEGPGAPMLAVALLCCVATMIATRGRARLAPATCALLVVYVVDFALLLLAAQHECARYFQPLMPILAVCVVRSVMSVPWLAVRRVAGAAVSAIALHHVVALSFLYSVPQPQDEGAAYLGDVPLWYHRPYFVGLYEYFGLRTPTDDFRLGELMDRIAELDVPASARIFTLTAGNAFFQPNGLAYEAIRKRHAWTFFWSQEIPSNKDARALAALDGDTWSADVVILRSGGILWNRESDLVAGLPSLFDPVFRRFEQAGVALELGDGSRVRLFRRIQEFVIRGEAPPGLEPKAATFSGEEGPVMELLGARFVESSRGRRLKFAARFDRKPVNAPRYFIHVLRGSEIIGGSHGAGGPIDPKKIPASGPWIGVWDVLLDGDPEPTADARGLKIAMGLRRDAPDSEERLSVTSSLPVIDDGTRLIVWTQP